ncbi:Surface polysaccharide O-acyltransferase, integral membrane enzyme [Deinococcus reticulitermitis]|uniref:Surface polysaccharide O-acyltransferase, integral membrane enzyme n=1 Tax=Deinococcus reticulitermitis TaxID=856736 RepID=A0A1H7C1G3_9DEIO|nr:acyltransferase [Deinococcus reticulitermitis]SEJ83296.1 Surface polysaccharide O-acyltransferase, integral membrane enzyme [Deinococcus reticulitermitis]
MPRSRVSRPRRKRGSRARARVPRLGAVIGYFSEQAGYRPGLRRQLREPPFVTPGLPTHAAMALRPPHAALGVAGGGLLGTGTGALPLPASPAAAEAHAPLVVEHQAVSAARLSAIDAFRGIAILEVVTHHATSMALRYLEPGTAAFIGTAAVNQTLHFAVPSFIFLSATVLTRSLLKDFQPGRYYWRRTVRGAWPYVLWSALYVLWYVASGRRPPEVLTNPERWSFYLLYGKASYHLYFMLVALQVYAVLPLLLPLARRRPAIWWALLLGALAQVGAYFLNREVLLVRYPASTILWYVLPIILGVAVGARLSEFSEWFRKSRWWVLALLLLVYPPYLYVTVNYALDRPVTPMYHSLLSWAYSTLMAIGLLGLAYRWQASVSRVRVAVSVLGTVSLQIYLLHPFMLQALERWRAPVEGEPPSSTLLLTLIYGLVVLLVPALLGRALLGTRTSVVLFGR